MLDSVKAHTRLPLPMDGMLGRSTRCSLLLVALAAWLGTLLAPTLVAAQAPVQVALVDEGLDASGRWFQRIRVTIGAGGSLTMASEVLYGDQLHADELFEAAKRVNPSLTTPSNVPVGQEILLTIDPRVTYIIREHTVDQARQARRLVYTNGVQRTIYVGKNSGVLQEIVFPSDRPARSFVFADDHGSVAVVAGGRIVDYAYASGEHFREIVATLYGNVTVRAMQDAIKQTGWDPNRWPPPQNERRRLVLSPAEEYRDERPAPLALDDIEPQHRSALQALLAERARLGFYAIAFDGTAITYRGLVTDPDVTAKRVAAALYGDEARWPAIAQAAGLAVENNQVKGLPPGTDPTLLGRTFDVRVDLADERLPVGPPQQQGDRRVTTLRNGTIIEDYGAERRPTPGLARIVRYPSGYKRIVYRPDPLMVIALDFLHFQAALLRGATRDESVRDREGRAFSAQVLWLLLRDLPREPDDVAVAMTISDEPRGKALEVVVRPRRGDDAAVPGWLVLIKTQPVLAAAGLTIAVGLVLALVFGLLRRPIGARTTRLSLARRRLTRR